MEKFEVFRSKDPEVSTWLQKNGFQKRRSVRHEETGQKPTNSTGEETDPFAESKELRFYADKDVSANIPSLVFKETVAGLRRSKTEGQIYGRLVESRDLLVESMPAIGLSSPIKQGFVVQERRSDTIMPNVNIYMEERLKRSSSSPPKSGPTTRRHSTLSLLSDRPCNIPVLIRNNNVRLRKYSCPEYYANSTTANHFMEMEQKGVRDVETKGLAKKTATYVPNNTSLQLERQIDNQTAREIKLREQNDAKGKTKDFKTKSDRGGNGVLRKIPVKDFNANEISSDLNGRMSRSSSSDDRHKGFEFEFYEEESFQSYSLDRVQPPKHSLNSSMYSSRSNVLTWLGEVNGSNPQLWS